jgi:xanthine dehydrogenase molybdopterin-binding subunit B
MNDGKIIALDAEVFCNGGWTQDLSAAVNDRALSHIDNCYNIPNVDVRGQPCRTNTVSNTAFRGFGGPQVMFIAESYMEEVSDRLGIPVDKLRVQLLGALRWIHANGLSCRRLIIIRRVMSHILIRSWSIIMFP